jgi:hypothetical protein
VGGWGDNVGNSFHHTCGEGRVAGEEWRGGQCWKLVSNIGVGGEGKLGETVRGAKQSALQVQSCIC